MSNWDQGWMNFVMVCPKGCGVSRGYLANDMELAERCMMCNEEMEGFRTLTKENK
jgi:hypothetical protein